MDSHNLTHKVEEMVSVEQQQMDASQLAMHPGHISASNDTTVILPFEEFSVDLEHNLGRANGNCYQRRPGIPNINDGQIMIRLKKKRFIIIDYSIVPTPSDIACAAVTPHIRCPPGAGQQQCSASNCTKIGVPVCLFDSDPDEPTSLYLRSGLCFSCQRLLNEKRRTQRKRKTSTNGTPNTGPGSPESAYNNSGRKKVRMGGEIFEIDHNAIIISNPLPGTKAHGPGYEFPEIMNDLQMIGAEANEEVKHMMDASSMNPVNPVHVEQIYNKTFETFSKGVFLLSQWKSSWDAAFAAEKATEEILETSIADVVASAAAVAAAQASDPVGTNPSSSTMLPLIMAAEEKGGDPGVPPEETMKTEQV